MERGSWLDGVEALMKRDYDVVVLVRRRLPTRRYKTEVVRPFRKTWLCQLGQCLFGL